LSKNTHRPEQFAKATDSRPQAGKLARRLAERRRFLQTVAGPRQAGKTALVQQVIVDS
jgi:predicted AAA+ superfamily ATPase